MGIEFCPQTAPLSYALLPSEINFYYQFTYQIQTIDTKNFQLLVWIDQIYTETTGQFTLI